MGEIVVVRFFFLLGIFNRNNGFVGVQNEKRNSQCDGANTKLFLHVQLRCGLLSITTTVSQLENEFDVRS